MRRLKPETIRELRKAHGLTTTQLAAAVGASEIAIRTWENGTYNPRPHNQQALADALHTTLDAITTRHCPTCGHQLEST